MNYVLVKNIEVSGIQVSDYRKRTPDKMAHCMAEIFRLYEEGKLVSSPARTFPLASAPEALSALQNRQAATRLVLLPNGDPARPADAAPLPRVPILGHCCIIPCHLRCTLACAAQTTGAR